MISPLVSIIIPCYNYGRFLSDALDSVLAQTYRNWECIVVDDGSMDITESIAKGYVQKDSRFVYIHQQNSGVSAARNRALQEAKGAYIQLLDADDMLEREKLSLQVALLECNPSIDLVYSSIIFFKDHDIVSKSNPTLLQNKKTISGKGEILLNNLIDDNIFLPGCVLFRKSLYDAVGQFKKGIEGIEDWDYFYRSALQQKAFYHDQREETRLLTRSHNNNASNDGFKMLLNKIKARKALLSMTEELLIYDANFSKPFIQKVCKLHTALLSRDKARLYLYYGSIFDGCVYTFKHAYHSRKPYFAFYDSAYWVKERFKKFSKRVR